MFLGGGGQYLRKYNPVLNWGVFFSQCFTTESVTHSVSEVKTLPQLVSCLGRCDGILCHGQLTHRPAVQPTNSSAYSGLAAEATTTQAINWPSNQPGNHTGIKPVERLVSRTGKPVTVGGGGGGLAHAQQRSTNTQIKAEVHAYTVGAHSSCLLFGL